MARKQKTPKHATMAELEIDRGPAKFLCPLTGIPVFDENDGFNQDAAHSAHLRFFIDWVGGVFVAKPESLPDEQQEYQRRVVETFERSEEFQSQNEMVAACMSYMPRSAMIFEILDPPWGPSDGTICYIGMDFASVPDEMQSLRLARV